MSDIYTIPRSMSRPVLVCKDPSKTRQEFLVDSLIDTIHARFLRDGMMPQPNAGREPVGGDGLSFDEVANGYTETLQGEFDNEVGHVTHDSESHFDDVGKGDEKGDSSTTGDSTDQN